MDLVVRPLGEDLRPEFADLVRASGPARRCWCMYWRIGPSYRGRPPDDNRDAFREIVSTGHPTGLLALEAGRAVGWCQLTPRHDHPWLERTGSLRPIDDADVWSISCFLVRPGFRCRGVATAIIATAIETAAAAGAGDLEAYLPALPLSDRGRGA